GYRKHGDVTLKIVQPHTDLLVLDVDHRPDVNVLAPALRTQQFEQDVGKLLGGVIQLKGQQPGGVQETFEVVERAEDEKLLLILIPVPAQPAKRPGPIVESMIHDADRRLLEGDDPSFKIGILGSYGC